MIFFMFEGGQLFVIGMAIEAKAPWVGWVSAITLVPFIFVSLFMPIATLFTKIDAHNNDPNASSLPGSETADMQSFWSKLPGVPTMYRGCRLWHEYFAFPARFRGELIRLAAGISRCNSDRLDIVVPLTHHDPASKVNLRSKCTSTSKNVLLSMALCRSRQCSRTFSRSELRHTASCQPLYTDARVASYRLPMISHRYSKRANSIALVPHGMLALYAVTALALSCCSKSTDQKPPSPRALDVAPTELPPINWTG